MLVDYKKRCVVDAELDGLPCRVIRYGVDAEEANYDAGSRYPSCWFPVDTPYAALSRGGRRPGNPIEEEWKKRKHHFNKRIMVDEESIGGQVKIPTAVTWQGGQIIQSNRDVGGVGAHDGEGGACGAQEIEAAEGRTGCGDSSCADPNCNYGNEEEVTT